MKINKMFLASALLCSSASHAMQLPISGGSANGVALCKNHNVYAWGLNVDPFCSNLLALDTTVAGFVNKKDYNTPQLVNTKGIIFNQVVVGSGFIAAGVSNKGVLYVWGSDGVLNLNQPELVKCGEVLSGCKEDGASAGDYVGKVKQVDCSTSGLIALLEDGKAVVSSSLKNLMIESYLLDSERNVLTNIVKVFAGDQTFYALTADGLLYSVGAYNGHGGGSNTPKEMYVAAPVSDKNKTPLADVIDCAAGDVCAFALTKDGKVYGWGNNGWNGCVGADIMETTEYAVPVLSGEYKAISGEDYLTNVKMLGAGRGFGAAVTNDGYALYWGGNEENGGVAPVPGSEKNTRIPSPVFMMTKDTIAFKDAKAITCGDNFGFVVDSKNQYYAFGLNTSGQCGVGSTDAAIRYLQPMTFDCELPEFDFESTVPNDSVVEDNTPLPTVEDGLTLVWCEDFGTATSSTNYWTWNFEDLKNPKKVYHTDAQKWQYPSVVEPVGAKFTAPLGEEGTYCVAANVTCQYDGLTKEGTQWGWQSYFGDGKSPKAHDWVFNPDHTYNGENYGGMLYVNGGNEPEESILSYEIKGLESGSYRARFYMNSFSDALGGAKLYIRVTDLNNPSESYKSATVERYANGKSGMDWVVSSVDFLLEGASSDVKIEIVSVDGGDVMNKNGNDFIIDDIQLLKASGSTIEKNGHIVIVSDPEFGTVIGNLDYQVGDTVSLIAKANDGYMFDSWSYNFTEKDVVLTDSDNVLKFIANSDTVKVTANFVKSSDDTKLPTVEDGLTLVWCEDFGTATSSTNYWTWNFEDLKNPKKVYHTDAQNWQHSATVEPVGAKFTAPLGEEGTYCVASNVTCQYDGLTKEGTQWGWQSYFGDGKSPKAHDWVFNPDHTYNGENYGGMLYVNGGNEPEESILSYEIKGLESGSYRARFYMNSFSDALGGAKLYIRVTDLNNPSESYKSATVERYANGKSGMDWVVSSVDFLLEGASNDVKIEIVSVDGGDVMNKNGNDFIIDDIQLLKASELNNVENVMVDTPRTGNNEVVDIMGRKVKELQPNQVYILNGKKFMIRR